MKLELIVEGAVVETVGPFLRGAPYRQILDAQSLTLFGVITTIGLSVGFGLGATEGVWWGLLGGAASFVLSIVLLRQPRAQRFIVRLMMSVISQTDMSRAVTR